MSLKKYVLVGKDQMSSYSGHLNYGYHNGYSLPSPVNHPIQPNVSKPKPQVSSFGFHHSSYSTGSLPYISPLKHQKINEENFQTRKLGDLSVDYSYQANRLSSESKVFFLISFCV